MFLLVSLWVINAISLMFVAWLLPGFHIADFYSAMMTALVLGLLNAVIRPILIILTLPINLMTLGLFTLVINALILTMASTIVKGFSVDNFGAALSAAALLWVISFISNVLAERLNN